MYMDYTWRVPRSVPGVYLVCTWSVPVVYQECTQSVSGVHLYLECIWSVPETLMGYNLEGEVGERFFPHRWGVQSLDGRSPCFCGRMRFCVLMDSVGQGGETVNMLK